MINRIVRGVAAKLHAAFGDGYLIHQNDIRQGLEPPCFLITTVGPSLDPQPNGLRLLTVPLDISYFPTDSGDNEDMEQVGFTAMLAAELIPWDESRKLRGLRRSTEIVDGVLHISVTYEVLIVDVAVIDPMEILDLHIHLRES